MTFTELEALRRLLFFSVPAAAEHVGRCDVRSWRKWESGDRRVPDDVAAKIEALIDWRNRALEAMSDAIGGDDVAVIWYRSTDDWMTMPGRDPALYAPHCSVVAEAVTMGARLVPFDSDVYFRWLGGQPDSEAKRAAWAAAQAI